jgi:hypothetical protein
LTRKKRSRELHCDIAGEEICATLKQRFTIQFGAPPKHFVECNQEYCQYLGENKPPCPLNLDLFQAELSEMKARKMEESAGL